MTAQKLPLTWSFWRTMFGNLTKVVVNSGSSTTTIEYVIDGMGRRVARRTNGNVDRIWLYRDGLRHVSEVDGKGVFTHFIYESNNAESGAPDALIRSGVLYRVVKDHLGSVRLVVNAQTGAIAQSIDYDAYGVVLSETGAGFQPFGFAGGLYDATTKLVRFGARDYDASTGRWTNRDPIGFAGGQGNQYLYVNGDPANGRDPSGLEELPARLRQALQPFSSKIDLSEVDFEWRARNYATYVLEALASQGYFAGSPARK